MTRTTIDYGIDLGTTNSVIARMQGARVEVLKTPDGSEVVPSVVWIDGKGALRVGKRAKERQDSDHENVAFEFKQRMGDAAWRFTFARSNRQMNAEELSAEVLKELKRAAEGRDAEDVRTAVITVPAAFLNPESAATKRAADLAGFTGDAPLLQEPIAAAYAYGVRAPSDKVYWLAFDLGGGTFDAAVINMRDGFFRIVDHAGDNDLGGKLIDWSLVEDLLIPDVQQRFGHADFKRGNPRFRGAVATLKQAAEQAKIRLTAEETTDIEVELPGIGANGDRISYDFVLTREHVARAAEPIVRRAVMLSQDLLKRCRLGAGDVEKVLLIGGPTWMPCLRERLLDEREGLGIALTVDCDPMTVVAEGAAIFAATQRLPEAALAAGQAGAVELDLDYKPTGPDDEFQVGGRVRERNGVEFGRYTIEFINESSQPSWRSGQIRLTSDGRFLADLHAQPDIRNHFRIELRDAQGTARPTHPDRLSYQVILVEAGQIPLPHSIGVGLANNEVAWFFEKGASLPLRKLQVRRTAKELVPGRADEALRVPVVEGSSPRFDRNIEIGALVIPADNVPRTIPAGSEIEITIEIDTSRNVRVFAFVPIANQEWEGKIDYAAFKRVKPSRDRLAEALAQEVQRVRELTEKAEAADDAAVRELADRIAARGMVGEVEMAMRGARESSDAAERAEQRLKELQMALDELELRLRWPSLVRQAREEMRSIAEVLDDSDFRPTSEERETVARLIRQSEQSIAGQDAEQLDHYVVQLGRIRFRVVARHPGFWVRLFREVREDLPAMTDTARARSLVDQAERAIASGDVDALQSAVQQLIGLLPSQSVKQGSTFAMVMSGIV